MIPLESVSVHLLRGVPSVWLGDPGVPAVKDLLIPDDATDLPLMDPPRAPPAAFILVIAAGADTSPDHEMDMIGQPL